MYDMFMSILVFLVVLAVCVFIYNLLVAPLLGRTVSMMPVADLLFFLILVGIVIFALQASGLWYIGLGRV